MELKECEICCLDWYDESADTIEQEASINETGRCTSCLEEWGEEWPDRL